MRGPFSSWFDAEHRALGKLIRKSLPEEGGVDIEAFDAFRRKLVQHIAAQEKVFFPALISHMGHEPLYRGALSKDHGGLVSACVVTPSREWVEELWRLLEVHHTVERGDDGFARQCDHYLSHEATELLARAEALPVIPMPPFETGPGLRKRIAELLVATGLPTPAVRQHTHEHHASG
ncbi:MAG: hemerythrin domain-containing protein [Myxococcota bacterium]